MTARRTQHAEPGLAFREDTLARPADEVARALTMANDVRTSRPNDGYLMGVVAAGQWLAEARPHTPISGEARRPGPRATAEEVQLAQDALAGHECATRYDVPATVVRGVLAMLRYATDLHAPAPVERAHADPPGPGS